MSGTMIALRVAQKEVKQLREFRDKVLGAWFDMPNNKRSLTYLLDELGYLDYTPPHVLPLGRYSLKEEWLAHAAPWCDMEDEVMTNES